MLETKTKTPSLKVLMSHYVTLALLILLIDKSGLTKTVKTHCKTGLKVIGIIYANEAYGMGTEALLEKEFKEFFKLFPPSCFNDQGVISADIVLKNLKLCIITEDIILMVQE
ncbi:hypothetical protein [Flavivirga eckloniae]|uniref:Uncharacterized protein n=1 Tax=Flavivirga eckloniae TaxID=1803846 RepID=A0A2K9PRL8_9FLAO|nr:hypothetical protein [Flavivirga eckloniae]AUP79689.1 hypothetical protein C1H87_13620 [Flavivirga eckloniae]